MTKIIFQPEVKGPLKALGLHHASLVTVTIGIAHLVGFGGYMALIWIGWYARQEWGSNHFIIPKTIELMDFLSPALVCGAYLYWSG